MGYLLSAGRVATYTVPWFVYLVAAMGFFVEFVVLYFVQGFAGVAAAWGLVTFFFCVSLTLGARRAQTNNISPRLPFSRTRTAVKAIVGVFVLLAAMGTFATAAVFGVPKGPWPLAIGLSVFTSTCALVFGFASFAMNHLSGYSVHEIAADQEKLSAYNPGGADEEEGASVDGDVDEEVPSEAGCLGCCFAVLWGLLTFIVLLITVDALLYASQWYANFPEGELTDNFVVVDGHYVQIKCMGEYQEGVPPVLFEHGLSGSHLDWSWIQPMVAEHTRTCSYSKSGYAFSERGEYPRITPQIVSELDQVVEGVGFAEHGSFVFVGHSFAGHNMRYFAATAKNKDLIRGIVFVDAVNAETAVPCDKDARSPNTAGPSGLGKAAGPFGAVRAMSILGILPGAEIVDTLPEAVKSEYNAQVVRPKFFETYYSEGYNFPVSCSHVKALEDKSLNFPVTSILAGKGIYYNWETKQLNEEPTKMLASRSTVNGTWFNVDEASHSGLLFEEDHARVVADAAIEMLEDISGKALL